MDVERPRETLKIIWKDRMCFQDLEASPSAAAVRPLPYLLLALIWCVGLQKSYS